MDFGLIKDLVENGVLVVITAVAISAVIYYAKQLNPKLEEMNLLLKKSLDRESDYVYLLKQNHETDEELMETLKMINASMQGNIEVMKIYFEESKTVGQRLQLHDDRSEKILTKLELVNEKVGNLESLTRERFEVLFRDRGIKEVEDGEETNRQMKRYKGKSHS